MQKAHFRLSTCVAHKRLCSRTRLNLLTETLSGTLVELKRPFVQDLMMKTWAGLFEAGLR